MKLSNAVISRLKEDRSFRLLLCGELDFKEQWIDKCIDKNKVNGPLTTAGALKVIREQTGLGDSKILEMPKVKSKTGALK